ncbi:hypothetical protein AX774_g299 [Zancudomyces culisetae]|uniref:Uncharacterized protein n=1 Tax=Zancudomyces culisetae TaxID=1213189 RepID=A0A1R1PYV8_ZANCU|nr:hypothetical protein AX774_g299 [Zancudomyces culisetae]|eukprot:OMH86135.1 hypothetical protein AX774_g299 [Zancudomyces culisetae]
MKVDNVSLFEKDGNLSEFHVWVTVFLSVIATGLGDFLLSNGTKAANRWMWSFRAVCRRLDTLHWDP